MLYKNFFTLRFVVLGILTGMISSCGNNENDQPFNQGLIPNVAVDLWLQPNTIDFIPSGSWRYEDNYGYRGIVIYRLDPTNFLVYERTCPYDPTANCAQVEVNPSTFLFVDSCCMSQYNIVDGMPAGGPSTAPLKQYFADYDGTWLHVYNSP
ncbi:MAG: hypothetical protein K9G76_12590 [Bacteroidales bacterium]|nr:hypothetical protein [Bacteroidales bacterium]MCF8405409.1 hypothetical protein [Bacteroidales bacterium]